MILQSDKDFPTIIDSRWDLKNWPCFYEKLDIHGMNVGDGVSRTGYERLLSRCYNPILAYMGHINIILLFIFW